MWDQDVAEEMGVALLWRSWSYEEGQKEFELACTCTGARCSGTTPRSARLSPRYNDENPSSCSAKHTDHQLQDQGFHAHGGADR